MNLITNKKNYDEYLRKKHISQCAKEMKSSLRKCFFTFILVYLYANLLSCLDCDYKLKKKISLYNTLNHIIQKSTLIRNVVIYLKKIILKLKNYHYKIKNNVYYLRQKLIYVIKYF